MFNVTIHRHESAVRHVIDRMKQRQKDEIKNIGKVKEKAKVKKDKSK